MLRIVISMLFLLTVLSTGWVGTLTAAELVKVTPLGGQDGEFCRQDRALIFEDPNGTRLLYDAGRTVAGAKDPRLGKIDVVLVSHVQCPYQGGECRQLCQAGYLSRCHAQFQ